MPSPFATYGATLVANGYSVIPIKPRDKAPGRWDEDRETWGGLVGWQRFCDRLPAEDEVDAWSMWPHAGVGIPCGKVVGLDADVTDAAAAQRIDALTREMFGDPPVRFGLRPKRMFVFRAAAPFPSFDVIADVAHRERLGTKPLQVLAHGRQFVAHGIHPVTTVPYEWPEGSLVDVAYEDLPLITEDQAWEWASRAAAILGLVWPQAERQTVAASSSKELATREAVEQALGFVPIDSCSTREDWLSIGMAIHAGLAGDGVELWDQWSAGTAQVDAKGNSYYNPKALHAQWRGFGRTGAGTIGPGTLFDRARSYGWRPDGVFLYQRDADAADQGLHVDFDSIIAGADARRADFVGAEDPEPTWTVPAGEPGWRRDLSGGLRAFVEFADETAFSPQPWISLGGALAMFGAVAGRRYAGPTGLRTNLYTIGIGETGSGKDHPLFLVNTLLGAAGLDRFLGGEKIASGAGMISAIEQQASILFALDEVGFLFRAAGSVRAPKHVTEILENMTAFYSSARRTFRGTEYGDKKVRARLAIEQPCMSVFGLTTPRIFWSSLNSVHVEDGTLARVLIFETGCNYPEPQEHTNTKPPEELLNLLRWTAEGAEGHDTFPIGDTSFTAPNPFGVAYASQHAADLAGEMMRYQRQLKIEHEGTILSAVMARVVENAFKVALVRAIANNPVLPEIEKADLEWGYDIAWQSASTLARAVQERVGDNEAERDLKRVLKIINDAGPAGMDGNTLSRRTQFVKGRDRKQIVDDLLDGGQVRLERIDSAGRPRLIYYSS